MVRSYHNQKSLDKGYIINNYNEHKYDEDNILITAEHGAWVVLSKEEYKLLRLKRVEEDNNLFQELKNKGIVLSESNVEDVVKEYRQRKHFLFNGPSLHIITPTMRCNARCVYCHSRAKPEESGKYDMDEETARKSVDFIMQSPTDSLVIEFQGGDCLLNYDITELIIDYAKEKAEEKNKEVNFSLVTNLTLMNEDILESLKKRNIMGIATSLDGPKEIHDKNRPYLEEGGTYNDTVHWIKRIKSEFKKDFNLNALSTITKYSLGHGQEIVDKFIDLGFTGIWLRPLNNIGYASETWDNIGYSMDQFFPFWQNTLNYILKKNQRDNNDFVELMTLIFVKKIVQVKDPMMVDIMSPCGAGIGQMLYKYNGDIYTCDEGKINENFKLGNVKESSYQDIFANKNLLSMMDISSKEVYLCNNCEWKPYCGVCPIYTYASQGTIVSKLAMDDKCQLYQQIIKEIFRKIIFNKKDRETFFKWQGSDRVFD